MSSYELIGATDAARILGISRAAFQLIVTDGKVEPAARIGKRGIFVFDRADIERLAAEKKEAKEMNAEKFEQSDFVQALRMSDGRDDVHFARRGWAIEDVLRVLTDEQRARLIAGFEACNDEFPLPEVEA